MATNSQGSRVGRTIALDPEVDKELADIAVEEKTHVSKILRRWIQWQLQARRMNERKQTGGQRGVTSQD